MGRIVVTEFISLDGVVEAPGGEPFRHPGWAFAFDRGEEGEQFKIDEALSADALLLGRVTYEGFAAAWPSETGELADKYNAMPKYVVSSTLVEPSWPNTAVLSGDLRDAVAQVKSTVDGDISVPGSINLASDLLRNDLVDAIHLMIFPVVLGTGRRLFGEQPDKTSWKLMRADSVGEGVMIATFEHARQ